MSAWKPGDVAMVTLTSGQRSVATRTGSGQWYAALGHGEPSFMVGEHLISDVRPLLVIDPEDHEQAVRLYLAIRESYSGAHYPIDDDGKQMQTALRSLLTPPKPDEPLALAAVVEDAKGRLWVRTDDADCTSPWSMNGAYEQVEWADVPAVRVLSEGVAPDA